MNKEEKHSQDTFKYFEKLTVPHDLIRVKPNLVLNLT